MSAIVHRGP